MKGPVAPPRRVRIDRLELDLRGVPAGTAEAAARALGPALAAALAARQGPVTAGARSGTRIDAGSVASPASAGPDPIAAAIAERIATRVRGERP